MYGTRFANVSGKQYVVEECVENVCMIADMIDTCKLMAWINYNHKLCLFCVS